MQRLAALALLIALLAGCSHAVRDSSEPLAAPDITEIPAPYRLVYDTWPTRYIPDVVVIQGGREFILQPEIPGEVSK